MTRCRYIAVLVLLLCGCATTPGAPSGSNATWPAYSYTYTKDGVQYLYTYPYGPLRVVTPSTPKSDLPPQKQDGTPPSNETAPPATKQ